MRRPLLLDVLERGSYICQLTYFDYHPEYIDGKWIDVVDYNKLEDFVYKEKPYLKGRDITVAFSTQKI